jgi:hypothetical protein
MSSLIKQKEAEKGPNVSGIPMGIRILKPEEENTVDLGPLAKLKGSWVGKPFDGWNVISVPGPLASEGFVFEVIPYKETLSFTPVVTAGNRGPLDASGVEQNQKIAGLLYQQIITSVCDTALCNGRGFAAGQEIHAERGLFLNVQNFNSGFDIARLSTIPHGNSVLALGQSFEGAPANNNFFGQASTLPTTLSGSAIPGYGTPQFNTPQFPKFNQLDPNSFLQTTLGSDQITAMETLVFSTDNKDGGILNIPFITDNVKATGLHAIFWIETIKDKAGKNDFLQLQYTQTIDLVFPPTGKSTPIVWPHVTINTLNKQ